MRISQIRLLICTTALKIGRRRQRIIKPTNERFLKWKGWVMSRANSLPIIHRYIAITQKLYQMRFLN
jgi:hypothetical protein